MLKIAYRQGLIAETPFNRVEFLEERSQRRQAHILSWEEQARLLAVSSQLLHTLITLLTETGLRVGREALSLKWTDVDLGSEPFLQVLQTKTHAGRRAVPLSEFCKNELIVWRELMGPDYSVYVFPNPKNLSAHLGSVRKTWASALKRAKIPFFPIYCLRATFASRLAAAGVPDVFVSQMIGHATGLLPTYAKAVTDFRRDAIRKLEELRGRSTRGAMITNTNSLGPHSPYARPS